MTRLRIPTRHGPELPAGDYEVRYVSPTAGVLQIALSTSSLGQKDKPEWGALQRQPGVEIECGHCSGWFAVADVPIDEVRGWRCQVCLASRS
jgi:hypothetical protein